MSFPPTDSKPDMADPVDIMHSLMAQALGGPFGASSERCMETNWRGLEAAPIFLAAHNGNVDELTRLLQDPEMRRRVNDLDGDNSGILHCYALNSGGDNPGGIVNAVLDAGGEVNLRNGYKETPLQFAVIYNQVEIVKALLDRGARVDLADWKGDSPVPTARKRCSHSGSGGKRCCKVLQMVLEAEKSRKEDTSIQLQADCLRNSGNKAFQKGEFEAARDLYTQSIKVMEEHRAFSNRALCNLEIGKSIIKQEWSSGRYPIQVCRWGEEAMTDALKACRMEPTFEKAYYRQALGHAMARDFPRAKKDVQDGLKHCPNSEALKILLNELNDMGVPDHFSNPHSDAQKQARRLSESGAPCGICVYCRSSVPLSIEGNCPFCTMSLETDIEEQVLIDFILKH